MVSSDIVGYAPAELQEGGLTAGACFIPVTGSTFDLTELVVVGYDTDEGSRDEVNLQTLDEYGRTAGSYMWRDYTRNGTHYYGWYDDDAEDYVSAGDVTFQAGEGLWLYCDYDGFGLQSAGVVPTSDIAVTLQEGGLSVANATPTTVDLYNCHVGGYDTDDGTRDEVNVQTLDEYGRTAGSYMWRDYTRSGKHYYGWFDDDAEDYISEGDVTIKPGEGLWTYSDYDGFTFVWPKVKIAN